MKKLLTFALLLMLMACEKNEPNIVTPELTKSMTTEQTIELLGYPDVRMNWRRDYYNSERFIYRCVFIQTDIGYSKIDSPQRVFIITFVDNKVTNWYYTYFTNEYTLVLMKNNPPR